MDKQREEFEAWAYHNKWNIFRVRDMGVDHYVDDFVNGAWEGWKQSQKVAVPEGFVVVPREPTKTMLIAADNCEVDGKVTAHNIYKAMIEAQEN